MLFAVEVVRGRTAPSDPLVAFEAEWYCGDVIDASLLERYVLFDQTATVFDVFAAFEHRKNAYAVIVTEHGVIGEKVLFLLTPTDFPAINRYLETFNAKPSIPSCGVGSVV